MEYFLIVGRGTLLSALNGRQGIEGLVYSARLEDRYPKCISFTDFVSWLPPSKKFPALFPPNIV
jgi:hypothetical protein